MENTRTLITEKTKRTIDQLDVIGRRKMFNVNMGIFLRSARLKNKLTQTYIAKHVDTTITFQQVQKYEKGTNIISIRNLRSFCKLCKITEHLESIVDKCEDNFYLRKLLDQVPLLQMEDYKNNILKGGITYQIDDKVIDIY